MKPTLIPQPQATEPGNSSEQFSIDQIMRLVEHSPIAISITDLKGNIVYINRQFTETTGYTQLELMGMNHGIVSYKTTPSVIYENLWQTISNGESWQGHLINKRKNGDRYLAEVSIAPLDSNSETNKYYMGSHRDVSKDHMRSTELQNQNELFASVLNTVPSAVALIDNQEKVVLDNLSYKTLASDFQQEPMDLVLAEVKAQLNLAPEQTVQASHFPANNAIAISLEHNFKTRHFRCRFLTLEMLDNQVDDFFTPTVSVHTVVVLQEFTREYNQAEAKRLAELHQSTIQNEMLHSMQESMHAVVHQLQGPVNTMAAALNMIQQRPEQAGAMQPMELAFNASSQALETITKALPERPVEARQSVNLNQLVHELSAMLSDQFLKNSIELRLSLTGNLPTVTAQPGRLRVAIKKLIDNALDAIVLAKCEQRIIEIITRVEDNQLVIEINDSGTGIAKADRIKVFEPFYSTKPEHSIGSRGIGLCVVQQIVAEHQANLDIHSSKLGGCKICFMLPRR